MKTTNRKNANLHKFWAAPLLLAASVLILKTRIRITDVLFKDVRAWLGGSTYSEIESEQLPADRKGQHIVGRLGS